jgi:ribosomal protein S8
MSSKSNIGKLLYGINSARQAHFKTVRIQPNSVNTSILKLFEEVGIIRGFSFHEKLESIIVYLKYKQFDSNIFLNIKQISKSSKRIYVTLVQLVKMKERHGASIFILSNSKGIFLDTECIKFKTGGEVLIQINI